MSDISVMTKSEVRVAVAGGAAIRGLIERLFGAAPEAKKGPSLRAAGTLVGAGAAPSWPPSALPKSPAEIRSRELRPRRDRGNEASELAAADLNRARHEAERALTQRDRALDELKRTAADRDRLLQQTAELEALNAELKATRQRAEESERSARESTARIADLQDADRRAETARVALRELRDELESARQQSALREQKLRAELSAAAQRKDELEDRLAKFLPLAAELSDAANRLATLHRANGSKARPPAKPNRDAPSELNEPAFDSLD